MKVISIEEYKQGYIYNSYSLDYLKEIDEQQAKEIARELQKGYMKLLSAYENN